MRAPRRALVLDVNCGDVAFSEVRLREQFFQLRGVESRSVFARN
jgi:hypothetical protein